MKVFLGGTVNGSTWRDKLMKNLEIDFFNPVVDNWTDEAAKRELFERENCDYCLYVLTPKMTGFYSIAELADDSFKKTDKTIFCYLKEDDGVKFSNIQLEALLKLKELILHNGAIYLETLEDVAFFLNSANQRKTINCEGEGFNSVFISYGRRHSLAFARKLYTELTQAGYTAWFDMNDIPLGVDFQEQIDDGISKAHNFIYIISPHSVKSVYCRKEVELAVRLGKRIIPILHVFPADCENLIHPEIAKRNWVQMNQTEQTALNLSKQAQTLKEKILEITSTDWGFTNDFPVSFRSLTELITLHKEYVENHTALLIRALEWEKAGKPTELLLVGKERQLADEWLQTKEFTTGSGKPCQAPCQPVILQAEYIVEARKNAQNLATDVFIAYDIDDLPMQRKIAEKLTLHGITTWLHTKDIQKGTNYNESIHQGLEAADNMVFLLSEKSLLSEYCQKELQIAKDFNKRIIPVLISPVNAALLNKNEILKNLQYIDFTNIEEKKEIVQLTHENVAAEVQARKEKTDFEKRIDQLLSAINTEKNYYFLHKQFLVQALRWERQTRNTSILLRGYNLQNAKDWLLTGKLQANKPLPLHEEFIRESDALTGQLHTEVFVSYSRTDSDFARKLNYQLQYNGKTTWFDQESIASGSDFQKEIYKGIEQSDNFLFIISEDAVRSPYCADEVEYAKKLNKRFISILCRKTDTKLIPPDLAAIQWIDFTKTDFNSVFPRVIRLLSLDSDYVAAHTRLSIAALEWKKETYNKDKLLRESEYHIAKNWLKNSTGKTPAPTSLLTDYIEKSGKALQQTAEKEKRTNQKLKTFLIAAIFALFVAVGLGIYGFNQKLKADKNLTRAEKALQAFEAEKKARKQKEMETLYRDADNYATNLYYEDAINALQTVTKQSADKNLVKKAYLKMKEIEEKYLKKK